MTQPMVKALLRPMMLPILPPVIIIVAITSVYRVIAVCTPVTVVPTSSATWAIDTFMTELSSVIRNCPADRVIRTTPAPAAVVVPPALTMSPLWVLAPWPSLAVDRVGAPHPSRSRCDGLLSGPRPAKPPPPVLGPHPCGVATQTIGSPQPSSSTPCFDSASTTRVRRCAAKVSTWAIIPP